MRDPKVREYIEKQKSPQKEICKKLRKFILETLPDTTEEMKWGVPVFAEGKFYIVALKDHVNIGFSIKGLSKKDQDLFEGAGKTMRHIKIRNLKEIDDEKLAQLLKMVYTKAKCGKCN